MLVLGVSVRTVGDGRRRLGRAGAATVLAAATVAVGLGVAPDAGAASPICNSTMSGGTVNGSLVVPNGATCTLNSENVHGSVIVLAGGSLHTLDAAITGSVTATNANLVDIFDSSAASLVVTGLSPNATDASTACGSTFNTVAIQKIADGNNGNEFDFGDDAEGNPSTCPGNTVHGSLTLTANSAETEVDSNTIGGSVIIASNTGPVDLSGNTIHANLICVSPMVEGQPNNPKDDEIPNTIGGVQSCVINTAA